jgi:hypothetical protein
MRAIPSGVEAARRGGVAVETMPADGGPADQADRLIDAAARYDTDWVFMDLPYNDTGLGVVGRLRRLGVRVFYLDDGRFIDPGADVYHNSSILAVERVRSAAGRGLQLLGPGAFITDLLRDGPRIRTEGLVNILVTFGGSDPTGLTPAAVRELGHCDLEDCVVRVVAGPGYEHPETLRPLINRTCFELVVSPDDLHPYLRGCDLALCAGGRTLYELLHLKKSALAVATTPVEAEAVDAFSRGGQIPCGLTAWAAGEFRDAFARMAAATRNHASTR